MLIIAGTLHVAPEDRAEYLAQRVPVMAHARSVPGCMDFSLTPDPLEPGRINVYERWESDAELMRFRTGGAGAGPELPDTPSVRGAEVLKYRVAGVERP